MEVTIKMDTSTVKGKVSAIRTVIGIGRLTFDQRLEYVKKILGEPIKVDVSPPPSDLPSLPVRGGRFKESAELRRLRSVPMDRRERVLAMILKGFSQPESTMARTIWDRLDSDIGIGGRTGDSGGSITHYFGFPASAGYVTSALLLGFERGDIAMTIKEVTNRRYVVKKARFHTQLYASRNPQIKWEVGIPEEMLSVNIFSNCEKYEFGGKLGL